MIPSYSLVDLGLAYASIAGVQVAVGVVGVMPGPSQRKATIAEIVPGR